MYNCSFDKFLVDPIINVTGLYTFFYQTLEPGYSFPGEEHNFYEINYVVSGNLGLACGSREFEMSAGHAYIIKPDVFHRSWVLGTNDVKVVVISFDLDIKDGIDFEDSIYTIDSIGADLFEILIKESKNFFLSTNSKEEFFLTQIERVPLGGAQIIKIILEAILILMLRESNPIVPVSTFRSQVYFKAIEYMNENITESLTLEQIAGSCGVSKSLLAKVFQKYVGVGAMYYFTDMKIKHSKKLLLQGYTMSQIAEMLSFSSQNYYSAVFKKFAGISPITYKQSMNPHLK